MLTEQATISSNITPECNLIPTTSLDTYAQKALGTVLEGLINSKSFQSKIEPYLNPNNYKVHILFKTTNYRYSLFYRKRVDGSEELKIDRLKRDGMLVPQRFLIETGKNPQICFVEDARIKTYKESANTHDAYFQMINLAQRL